MGHGKNKKTKQVGLGQERKETRDERRRRIAEEAKAREACYQILPYVLGGVICLTLLFALYVHSVPPKMSEIKIDGAGADSSSVNTVDKILENGDSIATDSGGSGASGPTPDPTVVDLDGGSL